MREDGSLDTYCIQVLASRCVHMLQGRGDGSGGIEHVTGSHGAACRHAPRW